jgi:hypothetical protein
MSPATVGGIFANFSTPCRTAGRSLEALPQKPPVSPTAG